MVDVLFGDVIKEEFVYYVFFFNDEVIMNFKYIFLVLIIFIIMVL